MALPKRRHSRTRTRKRRTHQKVAVPAVVQCPQCDAPKLAHNACSKCGHYKGRKADHTVSEQPKKREAS
ncbi:MAG: 50S ribosomal protein L32 [candidate division WS1 bacterium]|jgi:large subunit ribosomal protein L32|nr:50S ribosomal protein L32 [candidate division WS1 bacterium]